MKRYNIIVVFRNQELDTLFCKRTKNPYKGYYNFPGGKVEEGESGYDAAYRELFEETGITKTKIILHKYMDFVFYLEDIILEVYAGYLYDSNLELKEEKNPLLWLNSDSIINKESKELFAGDGNIPYILEYVKNFIGRFI